MTKFSVNTLTLALTASLLVGCQSTSNSQAQRADTAKVVNADYLITNGKVFFGDGSGLHLVDVGLCGKTVCYISDRDSQTRVNAKKTVDVGGQIVSPGFIDPHTHTTAELLSSDKKANLNYLTQGVTTVINGNDGGGTYEIDKLAQQLDANGIGTNIAMFVGHGTVRKAVLGKADRQATGAELEQMKQLVEQAMQQGAIGLSTGLYYVPGSYASTEEVVELAKVAAAYDGIYDTHLRDEATFTVGFIPALKEAIEITDKADIHLHLAHIKALGVDAWGLSETAIDIVTKAQQAGSSISADQYPWLASGTKMHSAIMPKWVMADSQQAFYQRLNDPALKSRLLSEVTENIRRRGGPESLLVTAFAGDPSMVGKTLGQLAKEMKLAPAEAAMKLVQKGAIRVASFNMSESDLKNFMTQPWVVTSSDGTNGHPRKYASFPKKFETYVMEKGYLSVGEYIKRSSGQTAELLGLKDRGFIKQGYAADIVVWDPKRFKANADFSTWNKLSSGVTSVWVNGQRVIENGQYNATLAGEFLRK